MPPSLPAGSHDASHQGWDAPPRADALAAGGGALGEELAVMRPAGACQAPKTYEADLYCNVVAIRAEGAADGFL